MNSERIVIFGIFATLIAFIFGLFAFNYGKTSRETTMVSRLISQPVVDLEMEVLGGSKESPYRCSYYFQLGDVGKSLSFAGLDDTSILVQAVGRQTAVLRIITAQNSMDVEITAGVHVSFWKLWSVKWSVFGRTASRVGC